MSAEAAELGAVSSEISPDDARREKLKKAGEAYFEKVLAQTNRSTKELNLPAKESAPAAREPYDDTFETVGAVVESSKLYVLGIVFALGQSTSLPLAKASLTAVSAPAILVFLHFLPLVCAIWLMSVQGALELRPFSAGAVQGSLPGALITGSQALFLFFSLNRSSVPLVLCWVTLAPHAIRAVLDSKLNNAQMRPLKSLALLVGALTTVVALLSDWPGTVGLVSLVLWAFVEALSLMWAICQQRPHLFVQLCGEQRGEALQQLHETEQSVDAATHTFMRHALPALPILLLGLVLGEGSELVDHELSVPAVTKILLSVAASAFTVITMLLISDGLARDAKAALTAAGPLGAVIVEAALHGVGSVAAYAAAVVAAVVGVVLKMGAPA